MTTGGGLYDPLGTDGPVPGGPVRFSSPVVAASVAVVILLGFGAFAVLRHGDERGEPRAEVTIERVAPSAATVPPPAQPPPSKDAAAPPAPPATAAANAAEGREADVEMQNGVRVVRMHPGASRLAPPAAPAPPR